MDGATAHTWARYFHRHGLIVIVRTMANLNGFFLEVGRQSLTSERECDIFDSGLQAGKTVG